MILFVHLGKGTNKSNKTNVLNPGQESDSYQFICSISQSDLHSMVET
jgi:Icc-related predicted phosphoesterase